MAQFDDSWTQFYEAGRPRKPIPYEIIPPPAEYYPDPKARERTPQPPRYSHKMFIVFAILVILMFAAGMAFIVLSNPNAHWTP